MIQLKNSVVSFLYHGFGERSIVVSVIQLDLRFIYFILFIHKNRVTVPLSAFLILIALSRLSDLSASRSTGGSLCLGFVNLMSASWQFDLF